MAYYDPSGRECRYSDAYSGGKLRPGYRTTLGDGEHVPFDVTLMDERSGAVFLTDSKPAGDRVLASVNAMLALTGHRPKAPPSARQQAIADQIAQEYARKRAFNDGAVAALVAKQGNPTPVPAQDRANLAAAAAVRDAARDAQYR